MVDRLSNNCFILFVKITNCSHISFPDYQILLFYEFFKQDLVQVIYVHCDIIIDIIDNIYII